MTKYSLLLAFFFSLNLYGQIENEENKKFGIGFKQNERYAKPSSFWVEWDSGLGVPSVGKEISLRTVLGTAVSANWISPRLRLLSFRAGYHRDKGLMDLFGHANFNQEIGELGVMTGRIVFTRKMQHTFLIGLGGVIGVGMGESYGGHIWGGSSGHMRNPFISAGIPFSLKTAFCPNKLGVGISLDGNINPYVSYLTLKLNLIFGKARN